MHWYTSYVLQPACSAAAHTLGLQGTVQLPNGWSVPAQSQVEALFIYREIVEQQCYLQYGIQIRDGDVVMDVGANIGRSCYIVA